MKVRTLDCLLGTSKIFKFVNFLRIFFRFLIHTKGVVSSTDCIKRPGCVVKSVLTVLQKINSVPIRQDSDVEVFKQFFFPPKLDELYGFLYVSFELTTLLYVLASEHIRAYYYCLIILLQGTRTELGR